MRMISAVRERSGYLQPDSPRSHLLAEVEPCRAQHRGISVSEALERADGPPVTLLGVLGMHGRLGGAYLHLYRVEQREVESDRRERRRRGPCDPGVCGVLLRYRPSVGLARPLVPVVDLAVDKARGAARIRARERLAQGRDVDERLGEEVHRPELGRVLPVLVLYAVLRNRRLDAHRLGLRAGGDVPEGVASRSRSLFGAPLVVHPAHLTPLAGRRFAPGERNTGIARVEAGEGDRRGELAHGGTLPGCIRDAERVSVRIRRTAAGGHKRRLEEVRRLRADNICSYNRRL